jgi:hypothetical protein
MGEEFRSCRMQRTERSKVRLMAQIECKWLELYS